MVGVGVGDDDDDNDGVCVVVVVVVIDDAFDGELQTSLSSSASAAFSKRSMLDDGRCFFFCGCCELMT